MLTLDIQPRRRPLPQRLRALWAAWMVAVMTLLGATGTPALAGATADTAYRIGVGDQLDLRFFYTPELNTQVAVRSDGRIAVPLLGEVVVEGMTLAELSAQVSNGLSGQVKRPDVAINLQGTGSQRIFVGGEVLRPGVQPLIGPLSLTQAVMVAEGLKDTAGTQNVVVLRRGPQGERLTLRPNLAHALDGTDASQDLALQSNDVIVVPKSGVANLNVWIDQYVRRNLPINLNFSYSINRGTAYP